MATPLTPGQLVSAFKKWGVDYVEHPGWIQHRRDPDHGPWGPVNGLILHHTGDDAPDTADENVLWNGRSDLPGPLCSWGMRDDGVAVLMSAGRANHAGMGSSATLRKVVHESYRGTIKPGPDDTDGNPHFYGQETMYSGGHPMTLKTYRNTVLAFAAVCDAHGWSAKSGIGHKEWSARKIDPGSLDMAKFRRDVQAALDAGPEAQPPRPKPLTPQITKLRGELKKFLKAKRRKSIRSAALALDKQLAKFERR